MNTLLRTPIPREPTGLSPIVQFMRALRRCVIERTPIVGDGVKIDKLVNGFKISAVVGKGGGAPSAKGGPPRWG